jgi:hypothetical protein
MLLSDYVIEFLAKKGINDVFLVSGGGIMYLLDSVAEAKMFATSAAITSKQLSSRLKAMRASGTLWARA